MKEPNKIDDAKLGAFVEKALGDPEPDVRTAAVDALAQVPGPRARALLDSVVNDESEELSIRVVAAGALVRAPRKGDSR